MRIYFEDGSLIAYDVAEVPYDSIYIDAYYGVTDNIDCLNVAKDSTDNKGVVYTNQILAFDNKYGWNDDDGHVDIYIRHPDTTFGEWKRIDKLTERTIRRGNNVGKLYLAGEFNG